MVVATRAPRARIDDSIVYTLVDIEEDAWTGRYSEGTEASYTLSRLRNLFLAFAPSLCVIEASRPELLPMGKEPWLLVAGSTHAEGAHGTMVVSIPEREAVCMKGGSRVRVH